MLAPPVSGGLGPGRAVSSELHLEGVQLSVKWEERRGLDERKTFGSEINSWPQTNTHTKRHLLEERLRSGVLLLQLRQIFGNGAFEGGASGFGILLRRRKQKGVSGGKQIRRQTHDTGKLSKWTKTSRNLPRQSRGQQRPVRALRRLPSWQSSPPGVPEATRAEQKRT